MNVQTQCDDTLVGYPTRCSTRTHRNFEFLQQSVRSSWQTSSHEQCMCGTQQRYRRYVRHGHKKVRRHVSTKSAQSSKSLIRIQITSVESMSKAEPSWRGGDQDAAATGEGDGEVMPSQHIAQCTIPSCVTKFEDEENKRRKYTAFVIDIRTYGGLRWTVHRRYRQFFSLNKVRWAELGGSAAGGFLHPGPCSAGKPAIAPRKKPPMVPQSFLQSFCVIQCSGTEGAVASMRADPFLATPSEAGSTENAPFVACTHRRTVCIVVFCLFYRN